MRILLTAFFLLLTQAGYSQKAATFEEAKQAFDLKEYDKAKDLFKALYEGDKTAQHAYYLGRVALEKSDYPASIELLEEAAEKNNQDAEYYYWLSESYFRRISEVGMMKKMGLAKKGRKAAERSIELDPTQPDARTSLIYFYTQAPPIDGGSIEKALEYSEILYSHHPKRGRVMRAMVYANQKEHEKADAEYAALIEEFPEDADVLYDAGMYIQSREQYEKALQLFQEAYSMDSSKLNALYQIGRTTVLAEDWLDTGEAAFKEYLEKDISGNAPSHASAWWRLGMVHNLAGRTDAARSAFTSALELDPDHKEAREELSKLNS